MIDWRTGAAVRRAAYAMAAAAALLASGCGRKPSDGGGRQIKLAHVLTDKHPVHRAMVRMAELVQQKTGGALTIDIRHSAQLGAEKELIEKVQAGSIQMTKVSSNALEANVDEMGLFALPFLFRDEAHFWKVAEGPIGREILAKLDTAQMKGLTYYDAGARSFYSRRPITGAGDLKGLKIRVQQSPTMIRTMEVLGAIPVGIKFGPALTQQLQKGQRVEAAENNAPSYWTEGHYKSCPHYYLDGHSRAPDVLVMNANVWQSLGEGERTALLEAAAESAEHQKQLWKQETERLYGQLEAKGVKITREVDTAPFIEALKPVYQTLGPERRGWVERIRAVK